MFSFSMMELVVILVIALVVFGPGKLPEVGKALGKGLNEFRRAMDTNNLDIVEAKVIDKKGGEINGDAKKS